MNTLAERLTLALARLPKASQAGLARACGVKSSSVSNWFTGETKSLKAESLKRAASYLQCDRDWLQTGIGDPGWKNLHPATAGSTGTAREPAAVYLPAPPTTVRVPVIGTLEMGKSGKNELRSKAAGKPIGTVIGSAVGPGAYAVRIFGDEHYPAVRHGACVIVEPGGKCVAGELVLIELDDGHFLLKELVAERDDSVTVLPASGSARETISRERVRTMHPITNVVAASKFEPLP